MFQLGVVFLEQGKASQALAYLDKALEFDPEHEQALLNSAILLQELGRAELRKVARERLLKLLRKVCLILFNVLLKICLTFLYTFYYEMSYRFSIYECNYNYLPLLKKFNTNSFL